MKKFNRSQQAFTLMEVMVSLGIIAMIASFGLLVSMDFYKSYSFRSEQRIVASALERARSQSLNNVDQARHGVHFLADRYIIFECPQSNPQCNAYQANPSDIVMNPYYHISIHPPLDVVFDQLSGCVSDLNNDCNANPVSITVEDEAKPHTISVNSEGGIGW